MKSLQEFTDKPSLLAKIPPKARLALGGVIFIAVIALVVATVRASIHDLYRQNPFFLLERIEIPTESDILKREVETAIRLVGIKQFESFLPELPLKELRDTLRQNPRIEDVRLRRFYPDTLNVEVIPRIPVAILHFPPNAKKGELLIDQEGMVLPRNVSANSPHLPTVIGIKNPALFVEGKRTDDPSILAFLTFLRESQLRPEGSEYEILNVRLDEKNNRMTLILNASGVFKPGAQLIMPLDDVPGEMNRVQMVVELRKNANETISYLNATYQNIPVRP